MATSNYANKDPSKLSEKFSLVQKKWLVTDALYGGTESMRWASEELMPKDLLEDQLAYETRLKRTTLYPAYRRTIQQGVARLFQKDIKLTGYPTPVVVWAQDVDAQGRDISQFVKATFEDALNRGITYLLIEYPDVDYGDPEKNITYTQEDALKSGHRPYWVPIQATQVLAAISKLIGGVEFLTHFRYKEVVVETSEDGLEEEKFDQVRIYTQAGPDEPVELQIWRKTEKGWTPISRVVIKGPPQIPIVPIYTGRTGFFTGEPPLMPLAETNVLHWQSSSEQRNILHYARVPFLHIAGWDQTEQVLQDDGTYVEKTVELNIAKALVTGPDGKAAWVETNGRALEAGAADLKEIEEKMKSLGLALTTPRSGNITATETAVSAAETNSLLKDMARALSDSLELALFYTSFYLNSPLDPESPARVEVDTEFAVDKPPEGTSTIGDPKQKQLQTT